MSRTVSWYRSEKGGAEYGVGGTERKLRCSLVFAHKQLHYLGT